ncbi:MAG TPA: response regulator, partial [Bacteroidales bacterium]|nr:response regulator [Bacteroidales bacterium]
IDLVERDPAIDLILMDIQMPKVNGIEATKRIRAIRNDLPVIAVTAYAYNVFSEDLLNITFDAWLTKPVRTREILKSLSRFLS